MLLLYWLLMPAGLIVLVSIRYSYGVVCVVVGCYV